uniref:Uncharacterized protein n=1 Tax=Lepeophtheirus salmonis TaxID=72036 RepID=A0A0K2V155_LEPSM
MIEEVLDISGMPASKASTINSNTSLVSLSSFFFVLKTPEYGSIEKAEGSSPA